MGKRLTKTMAEDKRISLGPKEAVALWIQGREVWNAWVEKNPIADISFLNVDFNQHRNLETINIYHWPFANFNFPTGKKTLVAQHSVTAMYPSSARLSATAMYRSSARHSARAMFRSSVRLSAKAMYRLITRLSATATYRFIVQNSA